MASYYYSFDGDESSGEEDVVRNDGDAVLPDDDEGTASDAGLDAAGLHRRRYSESDGGASLTDPLEKGGTAAVSREPDEAGGKMAARAYQQEMLEESLKRNIIVAMETGSGKTLVAVRRIQVELDRTPSDTRVWFLAPTVSLCEQQHRVLREQLPAVNSRLMVGEDDVQSWSNQQTWDLALKNVRVVVCPYQILLDALSHAFVTMGSISLIVFDEAHNCTGNHPGRRVMSEFYKKIPAEDRPHILGLTASPVVSRIQGLDALEQTLDAVCCSPSVHRDELLAQVEQPVMLTEEFSGYDTVGRFDHTDNMKRLHAQLRLLEHDCSEEEDAILRKLKKGIQKQALGFCRKSGMVSRVLGAWAVDLYIYEVTRRISSSEPIGGWFDDETSLLSQALRDVAQPPASPHPTSQTSSSQLRTLVRVLERQQGDTVGIIFVKERVMAAVLAQVLSATPSLNKRYNVGCMVGTSKVLNKRDKFFELSSRSSGAENLTSLEKFRSGKINLLVATSVLEEGIDVPACNLVVCFDIPNNLKSFIQRRGRARMRQSQLCLLVDSDEEEKSYRDKVREWTTLEAEMKVRYEANMRELADIRELEDSPEEELMLHPSMQPLCAKTTDARITANDAKAHLDHFCHAVCPRKFANPSPEYISRPGALGMRATVVLPNTLPHQLRRVESSLAWSSEANAFKDAAFQAYKNLYEAGLLNENLLPIRNLGWETREVEGRASYADATGQLNPWVDVTKAWGSASASSSSPSSSSSSSTATHRGGVVHRRCIRVTDENGKSKCEVNALLPVPFPDIKPTPIFYAQSSTEPWTISFDDAVPTVRDRDDRAAHKTGLQHTKALMDMVFAHRFQVPSQNQPLLFVEPHRSSLSASDIASIPFSLDVIYDDDQTPVRDPFNGPYILQGLLPSKPAPELVQSNYRGFDESPEDVPYVVVRKWPKQCGFFRLNQPKAGTRSAAAGTASTQQQQQQSGSDSDDKKKRPYPAVIPAPGCRVDSIPIRLGEFAMLIPSITHLVGNYLVASELLRSTGLGTLGITDLSLVVMAISSPSAQETTDYERIEFLGDSVLKLCASVTCAANNLLYPEGYLSLIKDRIISNGRLCRAAVDFGLDGFILTRQQSQRQWRHMLTSLSSSSSPEDEHNNKSSSGGGAGGGGGTTPTTTTSLTTPARRALSTKTLADVVEALIGVALVDGGMTKALRCIALFLPDVEWPRVVPAAPETSPRARATSSKPPTSTTTAIATTGSQSTTITAPKMTGAVADDNKSKDKHNSDLDLEGGRTILYRASPPDIPLPSTLKPLEELLGYTFKRKALLIEATTHSSYNASVPSTASSSSATASTACLERLEFLGDSILDNIVVMKLFHYDRRDVYGGKGVGGQLAHFDMHLLRTAFVNGDFLAFLSMEWKVDCTQYDIVRPTKKASAASAGAAGRRRGKMGGGRGKKRKLDVDVEEKAKTDADQGEEEKEGDDEEGDGTDGEEEDEPPSSSSSSSTTSDEPESPKLTPSTFSAPLWSFMRFSSPEMAHEQTQTSARHARLRSSIRAALETGERYPWDLLARLRAHKFYSDLFEALVGAVWVDSGSMEACEAVLERSGLMGLLGRALRDGVRILHPKEEVGRLADRERVVYVVEEIPVPNPNTPGPGVPGVPGVLSGGVVVQGQEGGEEGEEGREVMFGCSVKVGEKCVARVVDGVTREEARTRAAQEAVRRHEENGGVWVALDEDDDEDEAKDVAMADG